MKQTREQMIKNLGELMHLTYDRTQLGLTTDLYGEAYVKQIHPRQTGALNQLYCKKLGRQKYIWNIHDRPDSEMLKNVLKLSKQIGDEAYQKTREKHIQMQKEAEERAIALMYTPQELDEAIFNQEEEIVEGPGCDLDIDKQKESDIAETIKNLEEDKELRHTEQHAAPIAKEQSIKEPLIIMEINFFGLFKYKKYAKR